MNFELNEDQRAFRDVAAQFTQEFFVPNAAEWDENNIFPRDELLKAAELGFGGIYVGEEVGGSALTRLDAALVFEELSKGCPSTAAFLSIHNMAAWMMDSFGDEALRQRFLPDVCAMKKIASYCLTEPGSGSDAAALKTKAVRDGDHYVLNGSKAFISGGGASDLYVTMVRTGDDSPGGISCIVVENGTEGLTFGAQERKLGWHSQPTAMVNFEDCRVPAENLVGEEGQGFKIAMAGLDGGRLNIGACSLGAAQASLDHAIAYMHERKQFGKPLAAFQALQFRIADMATELEAARLLLHKAAQMVSDKHPDATRYAAMAKRLATDTGFDVVNQALQLHGGYGYLRDYPIERFL
ncbi:MAG: acyl-CoA dehydrogenase family protein, partial [Pseudomonadota bacterium]